MSKVHRPHDPQQKRRGQQQTHRPETLVGTGRPVGKPADGQREHARVDDHPQSAIRADLLHRHAHTVMSGGRLLFSTFGRRARRDRDDEYRRASRSYAFFNSSSQVKRAGHIIKALGLSSVDLQEKTFDAFSRRSVRCVWFVLSPPGSTITARTENNAIRERSPIRSIPSTNV